MFIQEIFSYLILASILMGIFYTYYYIALRKEASFRFNRFYLLSSVGLSLLFPFIKIESSSPVVIPTFHELNEVVIWANTTSPSEFSISWEIMMYSLYVLGIGGGMLLFFQRVRQISLFINQANKKEYFKDHTLIYTGGDLSTSSFFKYLFWDDSKNLDRLAEAQIREHELCHIRQGHSYDILFIEFIQLVFWFNPFIYLIRRDLVQTHEYLADQAALGLGSPKSYKRLMLSQALNTRFEFAHTFFQSPIKNRINMLNNESNQRKLVVTAILLLPILGGLFVFSSFVKKIDIHVTMESTSESVTNERFQVLRMNEGTAEIVEVEEVPAVEEIEEIAAEEELVIVAIGDKPVIREIPSREPKINDYISAEKEPKVINMGDIRRSIGYPRAARDAGIDGNVVVRILVGENGEYVRHKVINPVHPILTESVEKELPKLKFSPAIQNGKPTQFWVNIPFNFKLLN